MYAVNGGIALYPGVITRSCLMTDPSPLPGYSYGPITYQLTQAGPRGLNPIVVTDSVCTDDFDLDDEFETSVTTSVMPTAAMHPFVAGQL